MDQILLRLGEITNAWAGMEEQLCLVFTHLAQTDYETSTVIFYTPSSFRGRLEIIRNLVNHRMPSCKEKGLLLHALGKLEKLSKTRNTLVHAEYGMAVSSADGWLVRHNVHPSKGQLKASVRAQLGEMDHHLDALGALRQFFYFFCQWQNNAPCPIRAWAKIALIRPGITSL